MKEFATDFEFKDRRDYVHSSTLLETLSRLVEENWLARERWTLPKVDAKFLHRIRANGRFRMQEERFAQSPNQKVMAEFKWMDAPLRLFAVFVEEADQPVRHRIETQLQVEDVRLVGNYSGSCSIGCGDRIAYVENVIEANKQIHLLTLRQKEKPHVLNGFMKGFPLPATYEAGSSLRIEIENVSTRPRKGGIATWNTIRLPDWGNESFEIAYVVEGVAGAAR